MKYKLSPLNIFAVFLLSLGVISFIDPDDQHGGLLLMYLIPAIVIGLFIDVIMQFFLRNYFLICVIEMILILIFIILNSNILN